MNSPFTCDHCGERIGVYEPAVFVSGDRFQMSSEAADPELAEEAAERYHRSCAPPRGERSHGR